MTINHTWLAVETAWLFGATLRGSSGEQRCVALRGCVAWLFGRATFRSSGLRCVALREVLHTQGFTLQALLHGCYYDACSGLQDMMLCLLVKLSLWPLGSASIAWLVCAVVCVDGASGGHASRFGHCRTLAIMIHAVLFLGGVVLTCLCLLVKPCFLWSLDTSCVCFVRLRCFGRTRFRLLNVSSLPQ